MNSIDMRICNEMIMIGWSLSLDTCIGLCAYAANQLENLSYAIYIIFHNLNVNHPD